MCLPTTDFLVVSYSISTSNHNLKFSRILRRMVVSYSISTSNHNIFRMNIIVKLLYLIPFLHQTTTKSQLLSLQLCCILFHFYIKPQQGQIQRGQEWSCILFHFYIKPQHIPDSYVKALRCILFHFYIKPQLHFIRLN